MRRKSEERKEGEVGREREGEREEVRQSIGKTQRKIKGRKQREK